MDEDQHISQFLSAYRQSISKQRPRNRLELNAAISRWHRQIYLYDSFLNYGDNNRNAQALWKIWTLSLVAQLEMLEYLNEGTGLRPPVHLALLGSEIANLQSGVPARLLRLDGANFGDNMRSKLRGYVMLKAAVFLRLFMDRDGYGSQKAAAQKIADALSDAGLRPPGSRADSAYTGRTIEGWLRDVNRQSKLHEEFQKLLEAERRTETSRSLEEKLADLTVHIKSLKIEPNDLRKKECA